MSFENLLKIQAEIKNPPRTKTAKVKTKTGGEYSYKYADLPEILDTVMPVLNKYGYVLMQPLLVKDGVQIITNTLYSKDHTHHSEMILPMILDPQQYGALITYYRKYLICTALGIASDDDTDANTITTNKPQTNNKPVIKPAYYANDSANPADFIIPFGKKYLGKKLKDIPRNDLQSFADYLKKSDKPSKQGTETLEMINAYFNHGDMSPPNFNDSENIPF